MKNNLVAVIVIVCAVLLSSFLFKPEVNVTVNPAPPFGSSSGQNQSYRGFFMAGATFGGNIATTSTATTYTTNAKDFRNEPTVISWLPNVNTTVSLSSTSTLAYVPNVGDVTTLYLRNASTTAASSITLAAVDANLDLQMAESTGGDLVLNGLDWAKVTLIHTSTYLVTVIFDEMTEAD